MASRLLREGVSNAEWAIITSSQGKRFVASEPGNLGFWGCQADRREGKTQNDEN